MPTCGNLETSDMRTVSDDELNYVKKVLDKLNDAAQAAPDSFDLDPLEKLIYSLRSFVEVGETISKDALTSIVVKSEALQDQLVHRAKASSAAALADADVDQLFAQVGELYEINERLKYYSLEAEQY